MQMHLKIIPINSIGLRSVVLQGDIAEGLRQRNVRSFEKGKKGGELVRGMLLQLFYRVEAV